MSEIYLSLNFDGNVATIMAATKSSTGVITPLATESEKIVPDKTKNGVIAVSDDIRMAVSTLLRKILNKIEGNNEITGIYIGTMPRSMHGELIEIRRDFEGRHRVTVHDIENLGREIAKNINNTLIAKYDNGFVRDGQEELNVRGEFADYIVSKSLAVVVTPRHATDFAEILPANVRLYGVVPTQVAIARVVADEDQRVNGVMSFHIANQSSALTYIVNDQVTATAVVPFGFDHIIKDMCLGEVPVDKVRNFLVSKQMVYKCKPGVTFRFTADGDSFSLSSMIDAFNARVREIFSLAYDRILASLNLQELKVPVLVTNSLVSTPEFAKALSDLLEQDCVIADASNVLNDDNFAASKYIPLIALINEANEPCVVERSVVIQEPVIVPENDDDDVPKNNGKKPKKKSWLEKIKEQTLNFNDED